MNYKGFEVDSRFVSGGEIKWEDTGNGLMIIGTKGGKEYFIKKNKNVRMPLSTASPALKESMTEKAKYFENKQKKLASLMKGLSFDTDHVAVEEDGFWDKDDNYFVTITRFLKGAVDKHFDFSRESDSTKRDAFIKMTELIQKLHKHGVIHGDLKEPNFLYKPNGSGYDVYIIDFDNSYPVSEIPLPELTPYSPGYESPEIICYKDSEDPENSYIMTTATDIFTLALIFHCIWTNDMPTYPKDSNSVGEAVAELKEFKPGLNKALDKKIGDKNGATFISLVNWMLTRMPEDRPTDEQVIAVLKDEMPVPSQYVCGSDTAPYTGLWLQHENMAECKEEDLKAQGITSFIKISEGGLKYLVRTESGENKYTIEELLEKGILKPKASEICEPWEEDEMEFATSDVVRAHNISSIKRVQSAAGTKMYEVRDLKGTKSYKSGASLLALGIAKRKEDTSAAADYDAPWPEDKGVYAPLKYLQERHVSSIKPVEVDGVHAYEVAYDDGRETKVLPGKTLFLLGFLVIKK